MMLNRIWDEETRDYTNIEVLTQGYNNGNFEYNTYNAKWNSLMTDLPEFDIIF